MSSTVSLVIVTHRRRDFLDRCLASCMQQVGAEVRDVVVVVNPSYDGTEQMLMERYPSVKMIRMHRNIGFFPALNIAIANSEGEYVMTVDDDAYFLSDTAVARMTGVLDTDQSVDIVTCSIQGPREKAPVPGDALVAGFKTGFAVVRKRVFVSDVGYYPDTFFRSGGENYLATKVWDSGRKVVQVADVLMHHDQALSGRSGWQWSYYGTRSQILVTIMRDPIVILPLHLADKFLMGLIATVRKRGRLGAFFAAWWSALWNVREAIALRAPISFSTFRQLVSLRRRFVPYVRSEEATA